jgi:nicotinamide riboside kinase
LTTSFYSQELFGCVDPRLEQLAARSYEHTFLCAPDYAFVQDGTRRCASFRERQHAWYVQQLQARDIPFTLVSGPVESRVAAVARILVTPGWKAARSPG